MTIELIVMHPPASGSVAADHLLGCLDLEGVSMALCLPSSQWPRSAGVRVVGSDGLTVLGAANVAVASSEEDYVLVLDGEYVIVPAALAALQVRLAERELQVGLLGRRIQDGPSGVALVASKFSTGAASVWRRDLWLRLRGMDETVPVTIASADLIRRADHAVKRVIDLTVSQIAGTRFVGSHSESPWSLTVEYEQQKLLGGLGDNDTIYRNLIEWSVPRELRPPLVTVAIATRDRATLLRDSLHSVLFQTFQDFEVVVIDDGSEAREAEALVRALDDPRVRYEWQPPSGISAARNRAADLSRGHFTAVHDDDDIMLPWRLERSLQAMTASVDATYGAWANFDEVTAAMRVFITKGEFSEALNAFSGQSPGHGTWTVPTEVIQRLRYDEGLTSSVDHHFASRTVWHGLRWRHVEDVLMLRRVHHGQISNTESAAQKAGHALTLFANELTASPKDLDALRAEGKAMRFPKLTHGKDLLQLFGAYLPDHLVHRRVVVASDVTNTLFQMDMPPSVDFMMEERDPVTGRLRAEIARVDGVTLADLAAFRQRGVLAVEAEARLREPDEVPAPIADPEPPFEVVYARLRDISQRHGKSLLWLVVRQRTTDEPVPTVDAARYRTRIVASADAGARVAVHAFGFDQLRAAETALLAALATYPDAVMQIAAQNRIGDFQMLPQGEV